VDLVFEVVAVELSLVVVVEDCSLLACSFPLEVLVSEVEEQV
jgi:hypothetical protein